MENHSNLNSRHRAILSCLSCHKHKKRCNREWPCNNCSKREFSCQYQEHQGPATQRITEPGNPEQEPFLDVQASDNIHTNTLALTWKPPQVHLSHYSQLFPRDFRLMEQFVIHFKPRLDTFREASGNIEKDWLLGVTKHPASFNAIMYCGGTIYAKEDPKFYNVRRAECDYLMYKLAALNNINEYLRGDSLAAVADEIMLAVLILMHVDGKMEDLYEYKVHLDGLHQMITLRGGLGRLGYNGLLKNWYNWCAAMFMHFGDRNLLYK